MESSFAANDKLKFIGHPLVILGLSTVNAHAQVTLAPFLFSLREGIHSEIRLIGWREQSSLITVALD